MRYSTALHAALQVLPVVLDVVLQLLQQRGVLRLQQVLEATLRLQEVLKRLEVLLLDRRERPLAVLDLEQRPELGVHCQAGDEHGLVGADAPAARARRQHVQERGAVHGEGLLGLGDQVLPVAHGGLPHVGHAVGCDDGGQVLAVLHLALLGLAHFGRGGPGALRRGRGALDAGVHVGAVVVAHVDHVVAALHGAGERLQADVVGAAVAAEGHELHLLVSGDLIAILLELLLCSEDVRVGSVDLLDALLLLLILLLVSLSLVAHALDLCVSKTA